MDGYMGEIRLFAGNYAPENWLFCDGSALSVSEYTTLFSLMGTIYGGNGTTTFCLPDLCGRAAVGVGQGAGLSNYTAGQTGGVQTVTLTNSQLAAHSHVINPAVSASYTPRVSNTDSGNVDAAANNYLSVSPGTLYGTTPDTGMAPVGARASINSVSSVAGASQPHDNTSPNLVLQYIICVVGLFPVRN